MFCGLDVRRFHRAQTVIDCLKDDALSGMPDYVTDYISSIRDYFKENPYVDHFKHPPPTSYDIPPFDFFQELTDIETTYNNNEYPSIFDAYVAILKLVQKFKDGHVMAGPPCLDTLGFQLPIEFDVFTNTTSDTLLPFPKPYFVISDVYAEDLHDTSDVAVADLKGKVITKLTLNGGTTDMVDPYVALSNWAMDNVHQGYSPHAVFNCALKESANMRPGIIFPPPEPATISLTFAEFTKNANGNPVIVESSKKNVTLHWLAVIGGGADVISVAALCPTSSSFIAPSADPSADPAAHAAPTTPAASASSSASPVHAAWMDGMRKPRLSTKHLERLKRIVETESAPYRNRERLVNMLRFHVVRDGENRAEGERRDRAANAEEEIVEMYGDAENQLYIYTVPSLKIIIIRITGFMPNNLMTPAIAFGTLLEYIKANPGHYTDLIVDVRGNGGGSIAYLEFINRLLFPFTYRPKQEEVAYVLSDFLRDYWNARLGSDFTLFTYNTTENVTDVGASKEVRMFADTQGKMYTRYFTPRFMHASFPQEVASEYVADFQFAPEHLFVVTDGDCGSCCGIFTKTVRDTGSARLIGYSYNPAFLNPAKTTADGLPLDYQFGSFPAILIDTETIKEWRRDTDPAVIARYKNFVNFPPEPKHGMRLAFTLGETYSVVPGKRNELLFFEEDRLDGLIKEFASRLDGTKENELHIAKAIHQQYIQTNMCFAREVSADPLGCRDAAKGKKAVYGHPCGSDRMFNQSVCQFAYCAAGYYLTDTETCSPVPFYAGPSVPVSVADCAVGYDLTDSGECVEKVPVPVPDNSSEDNGGGGSSSSNKADEKNNSWVVGVVLGATAIVLAAAAIVGVVLLLMKSGRTGRAEGSSGNTTVSGGGTVLQAEI